MIDKRSTLIGLVLHWLKKTSWRYWLVVTMFGLLPTLALLALCYQLNVL